MELEDLVGAKLMLGIPGVAATKEDIRLFQRTHAGGLILFRRNFKTVPLLKTLIRDLQDSLGRKLLVAIDHEGGRVIHLAGGATFFPDARAFGESGDESLARRQGAIEAQELLQLGIHMNLSPVLDVLTERYNPSIGNRSYGSDPALVAKLGAARILGMQENGLSACAKHFPGLGDAAVDPHYDLPVIDLDWEELRSKQSIPFIQAIQSGVEAIMTSHPVYPKLDPLKIPATFSRKIVKDFLRGELQYQGLILTDDLEMGALKHFGSIGESACKAAHAGHDMLLVCKNIQAQLDVFHELIEAYDGGKLYRDELEKSFKRIQQTIRKSRAQIGKAIPDNQKKDLLGQIAAQSVRVLSSPDADKISKSQTIQVVFPRLWDLNSLYAIEKEFENPAKWLKNIFKEKGVGDLNISLVPIKPNPKEISKVLGDIQTNAPLILFCYDAYLDEGWKDLLKGAQKKAKVCIAGLLRNPCDVKWIGPGIFALTAYGFRSNQIEALIRKIVQKMKP